MSILTPLFWVMCITLVLAFVCWVCSKVFHSLYFEHANRIFLGAGLLVTAAISAILDARSPGPGLLICMLTVPTGFYWLVAGIYRFVERLAERSQIFLP
jgi:hypothetical protein